MEDKPYVEYDAKKNKEGATLPGVPLADMTRHEFMALPEWLRDSVRACEFYTVADTKRKTATKEQKTNE